MDWHTTIGAVSGLSVALGAALVKVSDALGRRRKTDSEATVTETEAKTVAAKTEVEIEAARLTNDEKAQSLVLTMLHDEIMRLGARVDSLEKDNVVVRDRLKKVLDHNSDLEVENRKLVKQRDEYKIGLEQAETNWQAAEGKATQYRLKWDEQRMYTRQAMRLYHQSIGVSDPDLDTMSDPMPIRHPLDQSVQLTSDLLASAKELAPRKD